jgi:hypothetical protein
MSQSQSVEELMAAKSAVLSKAQAFATMGLAKTAQPFWASAASYEERIASLLDALGNDREAAVHRISADDVQYLSHNLKRQPLGRAKVW